MAIKTIFKKDEEIPEFLKEHAVEIDGNRVVDVTDIEEHPKVVKLKNAYTREKEKRDVQAAAIAEATSKLEGIPEEFTIEKWEEQLQLIANMPDVEKQKEQIKADLEKTRKDIRSALEKQWNTEKDGLQTEINSKKAFIEKIVRQDRLREGLVAAGVRKEFLMGAMALLQSRVDIKEQGEDFVDVVDTDMGPLNAKDYSLQWVESDEGKPYVTLAGGPELKPKPPGHSKDVGGNPFHKESFNMTAQTVMWKTDPIKAKALQEAATLAK